MQFPGLAGILASSFPSGFCGTLVSAPLSKCYFFSCLALPSLLILMKFKRCCVSIWVVFQVASLNKNPPGFPERGMFPDRQPGISFICSMLINACVPTPWCRSLGASLAVDPGQVMVLGKMRKAVIPPFFLFFWLVETMEDD